MSLVSRTADNYPKDASASLALNSKGKENPINLTVGRHTDNAVNEMTILD